jgi:hypothetical protein
MFFIGSDQYVEKIKKNRHVFGICRLGKHINKLE